MFLGSCSRGGFWAGGGAASKSANSPLLVSARLPRQGTVYLTVFAENQCAGRLMLADVHSVKEEAQRG